MARINAIDRLEVCGGDYAVCNAAVTSNVAGVIIHIYRQ